MMQESYGKTQRQAIAVLPYTYLVSHHVVSSNNATARFMLPQISTADCGVNTIQEIDKSLVQHGFKLN